MAISYYEVDAGQYLSGTTGGYDATPALQAAIDEATQFGSANLGPGVDASFRIIIPPGIYNISTLDLTNRSGLILEGMPGNVILYGTQQTTSAPMIDLTGSIKCGLVGIRINAENGNQQPPAVRPSTGVLLGATGRGDQNYMHSCQTDFFFAGPAITMIGVWECVFRDCVFRTQVDFPTLYISGTANFYGITSPFQTLTPVRSRMNSFYNCEIHAYPPTPPKPLPTTYLPAVELQGTRATRFFGCTTTATENHFKMDNSNRNVTIVGHKSFSFYPNPPFDPAVFQAKAFMTAVSGTQTDTTIQNVDFLEEGFGDGLNAVSGTMVRSVSGGTWNRLDIRSVDGKFFRGTDAQYITSHRNLTVGGSALIPAMASRYLGQSIVSTTEGPAQVPMTRGYVIGATVKFENAPSGGSRTFTLRKNGVNTTATWNYTSGTGSTVTFEPIAFNNGDLLSVLTTSTSTSIQNFIWVSLFIV